MNKPKWMNLGRTPEQQRAILELRRSSAASKQDHSNRRAKTRKANRDKQIKEQTNE